MKFQRQLLMDKIHTENSHTNQDIGQNTLGKNTLGQNKHRKILSLANTSKAKMTGNFLG